MIRMTGWALLSLTTLGCQRASDVSASFTLEGEQESLNPLDAANLAYPGLAGVVNFDDDDGDGVEDWDALSLSAEENDTTVLALVSDSVAFEVRLDGEEVRIWSGGELVIEDSGTWTPDPAERVSFEVEFGALLATATLEVTNLDSEETVTTALTAAPMIMSHHNLVTETVWVMTLSEIGYSNYTMVKKMSEVLGDRLVKVSPVDFDWDVWVEDEFEMTTMTRPGGRMDLAIDSIRDGLTGGGLDDLPEELIAGRDNTVRTWGSGYASTYDSFGNLEVSPPMTIDGVSYPFGRIYYGKKGNAAPVQALTDVLAAQQVQKPFYVDSSWLCVGHVDEFTSFVPDPSAPRGFRFLFADTRSGWDILDAADEDLSLPRYAPVNPYRGHNIRDVGEMVNKVGLRSYNEDIQTQHLDSILTVFKEELGLTDDEIILFPSVFHEEVDDWGTCGAVALVPGAINMLVVNEPDGSAHSFMADPFFRSNIHDASNDPFLEAYEALLPEAIETHYVDDFDVYHLNLGEVHCGTNSRRAPTENWWEQAAHLMMEAGQ